MSETFEKSDRPSGRDMVAIEENMKLSSSDYALQFVCNFYIQEDSTLTNQEVYITKQDVSPGGRLGAEYPLDINTMENIAEAYSDFSNLNILTFKTFIPTNVLYVRQNNTERCLIWFTMPQKRKLFFSNDLEIPSREYAIPSLVFKYMGEDTEVYVMEEQDFFSKESEKEFGSLPLYNAPYYNIDGNGVICWGTAKDKTKGKKHWEDIMAGVEDMFFNSYFTHGYEDARAMQVPIFDYYNRPESQHLFDYKLLVKSGKTLKDLL